MSEVTIKVLLFAKAKELYGKGEGVLNVNSVIDYSQLLQQVVDKYALHEISNNIILAINEEYPTQDIPLKLQQGDIVAVIPPLSGAYHYEDYIFKQAQECIEVRIMWWEFLTSTGIESEKKLLGYSNG